jgi:hypothetical protein
MRLEPREIDAIRTVVREVFGEAATIRLFGSIPDLLAADGAVRRYLELRLRHPAR